MQLRCVLFDLGEVLLRIDFSRMVKAFGMGHTESVGQALIKLNQWELYDAYERGTLREHAFRLALEERLGRPFPAEEFLEVWNSVVVGPVLGIESILDNLGRKLPLYALTNSNETHIRHITAAYPWLGKLKKIFTSNELGARKPESAIYEQVAREIGFSAGEILFIDDRPENVTGARAVGFVAEQCKNSPEDLIEILRRYHLN